MGRVNANEDNHVVVELTPEDILYRFVPDGKGGMLSMRTLIKDLTWFTPLLRCRNRFVGKFRLSGLFFARHASMIR